MRQFDYASFRRRHMAQKDFAREELLISRIIDARNSTARDDAAQDELLARNFCVAVELSEKFVKAHRIKDSSSAAQVRRAGVLGLLKAVEGVELGVAFKLHASPVVWSFMKEVGVGQDGLFPLDQESVDDIVRQETRLQEVLARARTEMRRILSIVIDKATATQARTVALYFGLVSGTPGLYKNTAARAMGMGAPSITSSIDYTLRIGGLGRGAVSQLLVALETLSVLEGPAAWEAFVDYTRQTSVERFKNAKAVKTPGKTRLLELAGRMRRQHREVTQLSLELEIGLPEGALNDRLAGDPALKSKLLGPGRNYTGTSGTRRGAAPLPHDVLRVRRGPTIPRSEVAARLQEIAAERHGDPDADRAEDSLDSLFGRNRMSAKGKPN